MSHMSDNTIEILTKAGWHKNRNIDIESLVEFLNKRGFEVFPPVKKFLKEFGMLNIKSPTYATEEYIKRYNFPEYDKHTTDVYSALGDIGGIRSAQQFEYYAKEKLVIVGRVDNEELYLMVSESGKVYNDSGKLGDTFEEAWETIVGNKRLIPWWNI